MQTSPLSHSFSTLSEYRSALDMVIVEARQALQIFDFDLQDGAWNSPERYSRLRDFLLRDTRNRVFMVLQKIDYAQNQSPRLMTLLREHSYAIAIHQTETEASGVFDPFLIADGQHYVHRFHHAYPRGETVLNDPDKTQGLSQRFNEIWRASFLAIPATTLGL